MGQRAAGDRGADQSPLAEFTLFPSDQRGITGDQCWRPGQEKVASVPQTLWLHMPVCEAVGRAKPKSGPKRMLCALEYFLPPSPCLMENTPI